MTRTEILVSEFVTRHRRHLQWSQDLTYELRDLCRGYTDFPGSTRERKVDHAYDMSGAFVQMYLEHLRESSRNMMHYHLAGLLLKAAGCYGECERLHHPKGLQLIQPEPVPA